MRPTCSALELTKASHWRICGATGQCSPGNRPVMSNGLGNGKWKLRRHGCSYRVPLLLLGAGWALSHGLSLQSSSCATTFMMQRHKSGSARIGTRVSTEMSRVTRGVPICRRLVGPFASSGGAVKSHVRCRSSHWHRCRFVVFDIRHRRIGAIADSARGKRCLLFLLRKVENH